MPVKVMDLTIYVDHDKPGAFRTIQAAMDYIAKRYPLGGETLTVQIGPGTYHGSIIADRRNNLSVSGTGNRTYVVATLEAYDYSILRVENLNFIVGPSQREMLLNETSYLIGRGKSWQRKNNAT
jgi:hypothetical protein